MKWIDWISATDFFAPRGFEASVPSLANIRGEAWPHLPERAKTALHLGDYLSLLGALALNRADLERLEMRIPGPLYQKCLALPENGDGSLLGYTATSLLAEINQALAKANYVK